MRGIFAMRGLDASAELITLFPSKIATCWQRFSRRRYFIYFSMFFGDSPYLPHQYYIIYDIKKQVKHHDFPKENRGVLL
jgi:hypothetical protein